MLQHQCSYFVFLSLCQLPELLESRDETDTTVLEAALMSGQRGVADTLLQHGASVDATDARGASLLHRAVARGTTANSVRELRGSGTF